MSACAAPRTGGDFLEVVGSHILSPQFFADEASLPCTAEIVKRTMREDKFLQQKTR